MSRQAAATLAVDAAGVHDVAPPPPWLVGRNLLCCLSCLPDRRSAFGVAGPGRLLKSLLCLHDNGGLVVVKVRRGKQSKAAAAQLACAAGTYHAYCSWCVAGV